MGVKAAAVLFAVLALTGCHSGPPTKATGNAEAKKINPAGYGAEEYRVVNEKDEIVSVLHNGLIAIVKRVPSPVVAVRGYARTGSVYEGKWLGGGLSHLLEHLVAGGSNGRRTEAENRDLLQQIGNNSNAFTTEDTTAFFVNTTPEHMERAVDLVTGWMLTAKITPQEYAREYEVVQRELEMGKGEPERQFSYMAAMNRYRVSPARVPVIGYQEVIRGLSRDDVYNYYRLAYVPNNLVFAVTGNLDPEKMLKALQKYVDNAEPGRVFSHDVTPEPPVLSPRTVVATFPKLGQAKLNLAFPTVSLNEPDLYAMDLLAAVLGGGESSMLAEEIRDKRQLVSSISAADDTPTYAQGSLDISMDLDPAKIKETTDAVMEALDRVKQEGVDDERISRAKTQLRAARVKHLQTAEDIGTSLAEDYIGTGDAHFSDLYIKRIERVEPEQVKEVARKYLVRSRLITTALLPNEYVGASGLPKAEEVLRPVAAATQESPADKTSPVTRVELDNGTILLVKRIATSPIVVMNLYSLGGVTAEDAKTNGIGNLTMQMLLRGTKTRNAQQIAEAFDGIGGEIATGCGNNQWFWSANCLKKDFSKAFELYADVVNNPTFTDEEADAMKKRVIAQIQQEDADWTAQAFHFFKQKYFGPLNSPYQFLAHGTEPNVASFTTQQMRDWYQQKVLGGRRVLAIYGDVNPDTARQMAAELLGAGKGKSASMSGTATKGFDMHDTRHAEDPAPSVNVLRVEVQKTEQKLAGIVIGYNSQSVVGEPATYPITVVDTITSGFTYPTGYIFETLRGEGMVYEADAQNVPGQNPALPGTFLAYAGCDAKNVNHVVDVILTNIARVQGTPKDINVDWFRRSKDLIVVADAMETETPAAQAASAAMDELYGLGYAWHDQFADHIKQVQLPDVQNVARRRLRECVVTVSTPNPELVKIPTGIRQFQKFPEVDLTPRGVQHDTGGAAGK